MENYAFHLYECVAPLFSDGRGAGALFALPFHDIDRFCNMCRRELDFSRFSNKFLFKCL